MEASEKMKAVVVTKYGSPDGLEIQDVLKPTPKSNELLIRIHATTVTAGDAILRKMRLPVRLVFGLFMGGLGENKILGHELSGEVEAVGKDVTLFKPGDEVFASAGMSGGAYAEYLCLPESGMVAIKPSNLTFGEAAALPVGANTALHILRSGNIQPSQKVLIYGASGSVGTYAVQFAKYWGAEVTGVCSTSNIDMVRSIGADHVVDYTQDDFRNLGETFDVIFDAVGKLSSLDRKRLLHVNGTFLTVKSSTEQDPTNLVFIKELVESGKIRPVIDRRYEVNQIVEAHRYVDTGHKKGNIVIEVIP
jgi:NADPH:quinone reductase-like Zn-dependent oxidoreductase